MFISTRNLDMAIKKNINLNYFYKISDTNDNIDTIDTDVLNSYDKNQFMTIADLSKRYKRSRVYIGKSLFCRIQSTKKLKTIKNKVTSYRKLYDAPKAKKIIEALGIKAKIEFEKV